MFILLIVLAVIWLLCLVMLIRNNIVYRTGIRAINESHPDFVGGFSCYTKHLWDFRKWTYKQFYKDKQCKPNIYTF